MQTAELVEVPPSIRNILFNLVLSMRNMGPEEFCISLLGRYLSNIQGIDNIDPPVCFLVFMVDKCSFLICFDIFVPAGTIL